MNRLNIPGVPQECANQLHSVFVSHQEIEQVILYGSRAKGNYRKFSDIDITLVGSGLTKSILNRVYFEVDDLLLPYTFDISVFHEIQNPDVVNHIKRVGVIIYNRDDL